MCTTLLICMSIHSFIPLKLFLLWWNPGPKSNLVETAGVENYRTTGSLIGPRNINFFGIPKYFFHPCKTVLQELRFIRTCTLLFLIVLVFCAASFLFFCFSFLNNVARYKADGCLGGELWGGWGFNLGYMKIYMILLTLMMKIQAYGSKVLQ